MSERPALPPPSDERSGERWLVGPHEPRLGRGAVHVWRADLQTAGERVAVPLSEPERERAASIHSERDRRLWIASRGVLRRLLGRYLRLDPGSLSLVSGPHGKPAVCARSGSRELCFNLSHSRHLALYAFCERGEVGVDVQLARPADTARAPRDHVALARRALGEDAAQRLQRVEPKARERELLRLWTRYEAEVKRLGLGIGGGRARIAAHGSWIAELDVGASGAAAVACEDPPRELLRWDWTS